MHRLKTDEIYHYYMGMGWSFFSCIRMEHRRSKFWGHVCLMGKSRSFVFRQAYGRGRLWLTAEILSGGNDDGPGVSAGGLRTW